MLQEMTGIMSRVDLVVENAWMQKECLQFSEEEEKCYAVF